MIKNRQVVQHPELETQGRYCSKFCSCLHSCVHYELKFFFHLTLQGLNCGIIARKMSFNLLSFLLYLAFSCNFCLKINCPIYSGNNYHDDVEVSKTHPSNMTHLALQGQNMNFYLQTLVSFQSESTQPTIKISKQPNCAGKSPGTTPKCQMLEMRNVSSSCIIIMTLHRDREM